MSLFKSFLFRFPCEIRVRSVPLTPCRRKKRKDGEPESPRGAPTSAGKQNQQPDQCNDKQVQSSQVCSDKCTIDVIGFYITKSSSRCVQISSTVMDSPTINMYKRWNQQGLLGQSPSSNFYNVQEYSPWNNFGKFMISAIYSPAAIETFLITCLILSSYVNRQHNVTEHGNGNECQSKCD